MKTNKDFWKFAEDDLMKGLYWEELYNKGRRVTEFRSVLNSARLCLSWILYFTQVSALRAAGHPAVPRATHRQERDVWEQDAGGAEDAADQDHQHLLSGHAPAGLLHRHQVSCR